MGERHVIPDRYDGGWRVTGGRGTTAHVPSQCDAIDRACEELCSDGGEEIIIHGVTGDVRERRTFHPAHA